MHGTAKAILLGLVIVHFGSNADAQEQRPAPADVPGHACTDVEIDGRRTLAYDCLSQRMSAPVTQLPSAAITGDTQSTMSNRSGQYNFSAFAHRMGPNLGKSVQPFRPTATYPTPLIRTPTTGK